MLNVLLGKDKAGRDYIVEHSGNLAIRIGDWKYIEPSKGPKIAGADGAMKPAMIRNPSCTTLRTISARQRTWPKKYPERIKEMAAKLEALKAAGRSRLIKF